ncbi:unnamed protein product [Brassica napus]|uniref:(rape) hypothetical protein n=1 Tax=Brassica napus TaxID=3708 RepID=A0A816NXS2_BRANA|nr:unnamed protein product [Brassica napus]
MKFAVFFVMFFLFLICFTTAQTLIQDSCKKAAAKDPLFKYDFCVKSLETDPHSKAATNLKGLLIASTKNAESNTINTAKPDTKYTHKDKDKDKDTDLGSVTVQNRKKSQRTDHVIAKGC